MLKGFNARRLQRKKRKLAAQRSQSKLRLQTENLEERALLAQIIAAGFNPALPAPITEGGAQSLLFDITVLGTGPIANPVVNFTTFDISTVSNAELGDYTLAPFQINPLLQSAFPGATATSAISYQFDLITGQNFTAGAFPGLGGGLTINNDLFVEGTEELGISVAGLPSLALPWGSTRTVSITDNESARVVIGSIDANDNKGTMLPSVTNGEVTEQGGAQMFPVTLDTFTPDTADGVEATLEDTYSAKIFDDSMGSAQDSSGANPDYATFDTNGEAVSFGAGAADLVVVNVPLTTINDFMIEGDETVGFELIESNPIVPLPGVSGDWAANYVDPAAVLPSTVGTVSGTVNIIDDDVASISFVDSFGNDITGMAMENENNSGGDTRVFAQLNLPTGVSLSDDLSFKVILGGTAEYGSFQGLPTDGDFIMTSPVVGGVAVYSGLGSVTHKFPMGTANGATILFDIDNESGPFDDNYLEGDEVVTLTIDDLQLGTVSVMNPATGPTQFDYLIKDNEKGVVSIAAGTSPIFEGDNSTPLLSTPLLGANAVFHVTVTPDSNAEFPVGGDDFVIDLGYSGSATNASTAPAGPTGSGTGAADYDASNDAKVTVTGAFPSTSATKMVTIPLWADWALEGTETIIASVSGATALSALGNITIPATPALGASATVEINDDDTAILQILDTGVPEGPGIPEILVPTGDAVTIEGSTANDPQDYCDGDPNGAPLPPAAGPGCANIYVNNAINDAGDDDGEFLVALRRGAGGPYVVADSTTIANLDQLDPGLMTGVNPTAALTDYTINGGAASTTLAVTIPAGSPFAVVEVNDKDDNIVELREFVDYDFDTTDVANGSTHSGDSDITADILTAAFIDIVDNDSAKVILRAGDPLAAEASPADTGNFVFELVDGNNPVTASQNIVVNFSLVTTASTTAQLGIDYNLFAIGGLNPSQQLNPTPNSTSLTVTSLTIPAGDSSVGILVVPVDDSTFSEGDETVVIDFISAGGIAGLDVVDCAPDPNEGIGIATVKIGDNDGDPEVAITTANMTANEDHTVSGGNKVIYTISIAAPAPTDITGMLTYTNGADVTGTTGAGDDYTITPPTDAPMTSSGGPSTAVYFVIPKGKTSVTYELMANDDNTVEDLETIDIKIDGASLSGSSATLSPLSQIQAKIVDSDRGTIKVEGIANTDEAGAQTGRFDFNIDTDNPTTGIMPTTSNDMGGTSDKDTTITFTLGGTASSLSPVEYKVYQDFGLTTQVQLTPSAGVYTITLPAGDLTAQIQVVGEDDSALEGAESIIATLVGATPVGGNNNVPHATTTTPTAIPGLPTTPSVQAPNGAGNATVWIIDDDAASIRVTAIDPHAGENNSGLPLNENPGAFLFEVVGVSPQDISTDITISYAVTGSATVGTDLEFTQVLNGLTVPSTGTITIEHVPNSTANGSAILTANVLNDFLSEGDEFANVVITGISVPGLFGMTIDNTARAGAGTTSPPSGDCHSTFCSATYNFDTMEIADDDVGEAWLYRSTDTINFPWNADEETNQKGNFFVQLTNPTTTDQIIRFSIGGTTNGLLLGQTPDVELTYQAPGVGTPDLVAGVSGVEVDINSLTPLVGSGVSIGGASPSGVKLKYVDLGSNGRELYEVTIPHGETTAHLQMTAQQDAIVEGTEHIDIDLETNQPLLSSFYQPSNTVNNATLYVTETDAATIVYVNNPSPQNETTEVLLSPEGTGGSGALGMVTISVAEQIEGTLTINYGAMGISSDPALSTDYIVDFAAGPSTATASGGQFFLTNTTAFTASIPVSADPDSYQEADEKFKIFTQTANHNNNGVTAALGVTFPGGRTVGCNPTTTVCTTSDIGVVEIIDDDIVELTTALKVGEVDAPVPGVVPAAAANTTKTTATISVKAGTPVGVISYMTVDQGASATGLTDAAISTPINQNVAGLDSGKFDYVPVMGTVHWDGTNLCSMVGCTGGGNVVHGSSFSFDVTINGDNVVEGDQFFGIKLTGTGFGTGFTPITNKVTITDNDTAKISISNDTVTEPMDLPLPSTAVNLTNHNISFVSDKAIEGTLRLDAAVAAGNGLSNSNLIGAVIDGDGTMNGRQQDYTGPSGSNASSTPSANGGPFEDIVWTDTGPNSPPSNGLVLPVQINADLLIEADESINVHFTNLSHTGDDATVAAATAPYSTGPASLSDEVLIIDSDIAKLNVADAIVTEGETANVEVELFTMNNGRDHELQQSLSFLLATTPGTGVGGAFSTSMPGIQPAFLDTNGDGFQDPGEPSIGADYTNNPPSVTFGAGSDTGDTATGAFLTNDDIIIEATEFFTVTASPFPGTSAPYHFSLPIPSANATNIMSGATGTVEIKDNDTGNKVVITSTNGAEGVSDGSFTVMIQEEATGVTRVTDEDTFIQLIVDGSAVRGEFVGNPPVLTPSDADYYFTDPSGIIVPPSTPNSAYLDTNGNGVQDPGEPTTLFVRIPAGQPSATVGVEIVDDTTNESLENIIVTANAVNNVPFPRDINFICSTTGAPSSATSTIAASDGGGGTGTPFTPTNISISGSSWGASSARAPYQLTNNVSHSAPSGFHGRTLPWINLNTVTVNYTGAAPTAGNLTLSDPSLIVSFNSALLGVATWTVTDNFNPLAFIPGITNEIGVKNDLTLSSAGLSVTVDIVPGDNTGSFLTDVGDIVNWVNSNADMTPFTLVQSQYVDVDGSGLVDINDVRLVVQATGASTVPSAAALDAADAVFANDRVRSLGLGGEVEISNGSSAERLRGRRTSRSMDRRGVALSQVSDVVETSVLDDVLANDDFGFSQF